MPAKLTPVTKQQENDILRMYSEGLGAPSIAKKFGFANSVIYRVVRKYGIEVKKSNAAKSLNNEELELAINLYSSGVATTEIAARLNRKSNNTVIKALRKAGIQVEAHMRSKFDFWSEEYKMSVIKEYVNGESLERVAEKHSSNANSMAQFLRKNGVEIRNGRSLKDSVACFLNGTGNFKVDYDSTFYVHEMKNYSGFVKPGLCSTGQRAHRDKEYGNKVLEIYGSRREMWLIEQAVLFETRNKMDCPSQLEGQWLGWTEVRKMDEVDIVAVVDYMLQELDELGMWGFAAKYVPMTDHQRECCKAKC